MMTRGWVARLALAGLAALVGVGLALVSATAGGAVVLEPVGPGVVPAVGVVAPSWSVSATLHPSGTIKGSKTSPPPTPN